MFSFQISELVLEEATNCTIKNYLTGIYSHNVLSVAMLRGISFTVAPTICQRA